MLQRDPQVVAALEARALEGMARALREHARQLMEAARVRGALFSREASLQMQVFAERCAQADEVLQSGGAVDESRIARLEQLISALECSRDYFRGLQTAAPPVRAWDLGRGIPRWLFAGLRLPLILRG